MDWADIQSGFTSLQIAVNVGQSLLQRYSVPDEVRQGIIDINSALISAQASALNAQTAHAASLTRINQLEQEVVRMKDWSAEKTRYHLAPLWQGAVMGYAIKESMCNGEPPHALCANCFSAGNKSILQINNPPRGAAATAKISCPNCRAEIATRYSFIGPPKYAEHYSTPTDGQTA